MQIFVEQNLITMERKQFTITINAPREAVWSILWNEATYPLWTAPFCEGSRAVTDWEKGSKVLFLSGENDGLSSVIAEKAPNEFMSFKHLGVVKKGVEAFDEESTKGWAGAMENYTLKPANGGTEVVVDIDITKEYEDYFMTTWPKALEKLKELAE